MTRYGERIRGERELEDDARGGMRVAATVVAVVVLAAVGAVLGTLVSWCLGGGA